MLSNKAKQQALARTDSAALKIATTPTMDCLPIFMAYNDSVFQRHGVDVHLRMRTSQLDGDTLLAGGYVEGAVTDLIRAERLQKLGTPLRYVAATNAYWQFITNRQARIKDLKQMSDKMVAMTRYSVTDYLATLAIDSARPRNEVYRVQINDVTIRLRMLLNNELDAAILTEPQAAMARFQQNPVLMDSRGKDFQPGVIVFREKALKDPRRQEQLRRFVEVYNAQCDSINKNGVKHYTKIIEKYMQVHGKALTALPNLKYPHAVAPRNKDINRAHRYWY
jgi:NitT/TauT family transport system substrate-binding protein